LFYFLIEQNDYQKCYYREFKRRQKFKAWSDAVLYCS